MSNRLKFEERLRTEETALGTGVLGEYEILRQADRLRAQVVGRFFGRIFAPIGRIVRSIDRALEGAHLGSRLAELDDRILADIGIERTDVPRLVAGLPLNKHGEPKDKLAA